MTPDLFAPREALACGETTAAAGMARAVRAAAAPPARHAVISTRFQAARAVATTVVRA